MGKKGTQVFLSFEQVAISVEPESLHEGLRYLS